MEFIISDESVTRHGFWVATNGIDTGDFARNPIVLFQHEERMMPIGRLENLRIDSNRLIGSVIFDETDPLAAEVKRKCEKGFLNAVSMGIEILEVDYNEALRKNGQTLGTITRCSLLEVSIVTIPSNKNAIKLHAIQARGVVVKLESPTTTQDDIHKIIKPLSMSMSKVTKSLALPENATEDEIAAAIAKQKELILAIAKLALPDNEDFNGYVTQGDTRSAMAYLSALKMQPRISIKQTLQTGKEDREDTFDYLQRNNPARLAQLRAQQPAQYEKLVQDHLSKKQK